MSGPVLAFLVRQQQDLISDRAVEAAAEAFLHWQFRDIRWTEATEELRTTFRNGARQALRAAIEAMRRSTPG